MHNLIAGTIILKPELNRSTPFHNEHSTKIVGHSKTMGGDSRYLNNLFINGDLTTYDKAKLPMKMEGNLYLGKSKLSIHERNSHVQPSVKLTAKLTQKANGADGYYLSISSAPEWKLLPSPQIITPEVLGKASVPNLPFLQPDGSPYRLDADYFGEKRKTSTPSPGPFSHPWPTRQKTGTLEFKVWPT